jgi:hypothetical protein
VNFNDLISYLVKYKGPGEKVVLTILRDGDTLELEVTSKKALPHNIVILPGGNQSLSACGPIQA